MEGRTIVRPDEAQGNTCRHRSAAFNGGPDNRPARHQRRANTPSGKNPLQWRAGQSSGQTRMVPRRQSLRCTPSMEGRTIVRPDPSGTSEPPTGHTTFNGGPDNRPARRGEPVCVAGDQPAFNGGPDNRPARPYCRLVPSRESNPFNGGPDNRPARHDTGVFAAKPAATLQWRAGQSSGQTPVV